MRADRINQLGVSIIIEWENVERAGMARARAMLSELERQARLLRGVSTAVGSGGLTSFFSRLRFPFEVLLVHPQNAEGEAGPPFRDPGSSADLDVVLDTHLLAVPRNGYYGLKNHGFEHSTGDLVVFLDSDVIPDDGWMAGLLGAFQDPAVLVVGGNAYIRPDGLYAKAFSLFWFFPPRADAATLLPARSFFANNVAFRRGIFARHPFPDMAGASRGSCLLLGEELEKAGIRVHRSTHAQVSHPPPNGWRHFVIRGLAQGRDRVLRAQQQGRKRDARLSAAFARLVRNSARSIISIAMERRRADLSLPAVPAAAALALAYYLFCLLGELLTHAKPTFAMNRFRI